MGFRTAVGVFTLKLVWSTLLVSISAQPAGIVCPSVYNQLPGKACQTWVCQQLVGIYNATQTPQQQWVESADWSTALASGCGAYIGQGFNPSAIPRYCGWHGVGCCCQPNDNEPGVSLPNCTTCRYNGSIETIDLSVNSITGDISSAQLLSSLEGLHAVGLERFVVGGSNLTGQFSDRWAGLNNLKQLDISASRISGTIPPAFANLTSLVTLRVASSTLTGTIPAAIGNLTQLQALDFGFNQLTGTMPPELSKLTKLKQLNLEVNYLTGTVPPLLCGDGAGAPGATGLSDLSLRANLLSGPVTGLENCVNLVALNLEINSFSGPLPASALWTQLHLLRAGTNNFSGPLPEALYEIRPLQIFTLSNNSLTGSVSRRVVLLQYLQNFHVDNNKLTGVVPEELFYLPDLTRLQLFNNQLTGTIPQSIGRATRSLQFLDISSTNISGVIPNSLGSINYLATANFINTNLTAPCVDQQQMPPQCQDANPLPSFLSFGSTTAGNDLLPPPTANVSAPLYLNMRCPPVNSQNPRQTWSVDPYYYGFKGCRCVSGWDFKAKLVRGRWVLTCVPVASRLQGWQLALIVLASVAMALLLVVTLVLALWYGSGYTPGFVRGFKNAQKRLAGVPKGGTVTVVVTDIEGYSELMKRMPDIMTRALAQHNAVVRKAAWSNVGYVLEQEGDSYSLAFYDAMDAVQFCLQAQLALFKADWPEHMGLEGDDSLFPSKRSSKSTLSVLFKRKRPRSGPAGTDPEDSTSIKSNRANSGLLQQSSELLGLRTDSEQHSSGTQTHYGSMGMSSNVYNPTLFHGLRVRMGVATGDLGGSEDPKHSRVMGIAKLVSDMANGGQVLLHQATFEAIKDRLHELGAVDANGVNFKNLATRPRGWLARKLMRTKRMPREAIALDMGRWSLTGLSPVAVGGRAGGATPPPPGTAASAAPTPGTATTTVPTPGTATTTTPAAPTAANLSTAAAAGNPGSTVIDIGPGGGAQPSSEPEGLTLRIYQILSPKLVGRARHFLNKLNMPPGSVQLDPPYFYAPGTQSAPLDVSADSTGITLQSVTMVFAAVEGAKQLMLRHSSEASQVHQLVSACLRECLQVATEQLKCHGYVCREQPQDLKYMVVFSTPKCALEWCLLVQHALLQVDWPESLLWQARFREEVSPEGRLMFRGPRLKMGVCEGNPKCILPDHMARADYHGACINNAARFMDAAAHGGQVVCEQELARQVVQEWRYGPVLAALPVSGRNPLGNDSTSSTVVLRTRGDNVSVTIAPTSPLLGASVPASAVSAGPLPRSASLDAFTAPPHLLVERSRSGGLLEFVVDGNHTAPSITADALAQGSATLRDQAGGANSGSSRGSGMNEHDRAMLSNVSAFGSDISGSAFAAAVAAAEARHASGRNASPDPLSADVAELGPGGGAAIARWGDLMLADQCTPGGGAGNPLWPLLPSGVASPSPEPRLHTPTAVMPPSLPSPAANRRPSPPPPPPPRAQTPPPPPPDSAFAAAAATAHPPSAASGPPPVPWSSDSVCSPLLPVTRQRSAELRPRPLLPPLLDAPEPSPHSGVSMPTPLPSPAGDEADTYVSAEDASPNLPECPQSVTPDVPCQPELVQVMVHDIGTYRFKGNPEPMPMATLGLSQFAERMYPTEAPSGKGICMEARRVLLDSVCVNLPLIERPEVISGSDMMGGSQAGTDSGNGHSRPAGALRMGGRTVRHAMARARRVLHRARSGVPLPGAPAGGLESGGRGVEVSSISEPGDLYGSGASGSGISSAAVATIATAGGGDFASGRSIRSTPPKLRQSSALSGRRRRSADVAAQSLDISMGGWTSRPSSPWCMNGRHATRPPRCEGVRRPGTAGAIPRGF